MSLLRPRPPSPRSSPGVRRDAHGPARRGDGTDRGRAEGAVPVCSSGPDGPGYDGGGGVHRSCPRSSRGQGGYPRRDADGHEGTPFPASSLVGVVLAETSLMVPDFRRRSGRSTSSLCRWREGRGGERCWEKRSSRPLCPGTPSSPSSRNTTSPGSPRRNFPRDARCAILPSSVSCAC